MNSTHSSDDPRLATRIGSLHLLNPIICGSGEHVMSAAGIRAALGAGAAGVVAKSVNESLNAARQLDSADYVQLASDGSTVPWRLDDGSLGRSLLCRSGLAGHPPEQWFSEIAALDREASRNSRFVAASIVLADPSAACTLAALAAEKGVRILELNIGAPHGAEARAGAITVLNDPGRIDTIAQSVRRNFPGSLWIKLSNGAGNLLDQAQAAQRGGADALVLTGRTLGMMPDLETLRPVLRTSAAYGGQWAVPITCRALALVRRALGPEFPLIGTNGARSGLDVARFVLAGASAVEMTSAVWLSGFGALAQSRQQLLDWLQRKDISAGAALGVAADAMESYAEQPEVERHWRKFVPPEADA